MVAQSICPPSAPFNNLLESVVEQTTLDAYSDVSFVIILPIFYFIFKFIIIPIEAASKALKPRKIAPRKVIKMPS